MTVAREHAAEPRCSELRVSIAGITTAITSDAPDLDLGIDGPTARFLSEAAAPDIRLRAAWSGPDQTAPGDKLFDSGGTWRLFRDGDLLVFQVRSPTFGALPYKTATFSTDFSTGVVHLRRSCFPAGHRLYPLEYPLDEILITNWLSLGRGVEVHACAVVDQDGRGYLFAGHSGAGKTTMARQWCGQTGVTVLSDDRIILRKIGDRIWMHGTPWHGDEPLASPDCAPLTHGFFLCHASRHALSPVGDAEAVARLFARSFPPFYSASGLDFTLSLLSDIARLVPFAELGFVPDRSLLDFLRVSSPSR
jgi:AAA domain